MKPKNPHSSPARLSAAGKLKRPLLFTLASSGVFLALFAPLLASASIFSISGFLAGLTRESEAAGSRQNSQTLPLLTPARNIDPSPSVGGGDITLVQGSALLAEEGPSGTLSDVENAPPEATAISVYTVHKGDTVTGIANMFGVTSNTILWANDIKGGVLKEGQELVILPIAGVRHAVIKGDTLGSLAKKYKADQGEIAQYNNLDAGGALAVGTTVIIPDGEVVVPAARPSVKIKAGTNLYKGGSGPDLGGYYAWPVAGGVVTQGIHGYNGIDIGAPSGTRIFAAAAGTVIIANGGGGWNGGYGNYVVIQHDNGTQTLYSHMSKVLTSRGAHVSQGETIGLIGRTGKATGAHLHVEVRGATNPFVNGR